MLNKTKSSDLIKILWHDGLGISLYAKRLERGRFLWPSPSDGAVSVTAALQPAKRHAWRKITPPLTSLEIHIEILQSVNPVEALAGGSALRNLVIQSPGWLFYNRYGDERWLRPG